jgi:hypothetical protein
MKRLSRECLELANGEMEKQKLSDEKFIVELLSEIAHLEIANNTLIIKIRKMRVS